MIKCLSIVTLIVFNLVLNAQNIFSSEPTNSHFYAPFTVTVFGNGKLYYTIDESEPNLSSTSAVNSFSVYINENRTVKVFLVDNNNNTSETKTFKYFTGPIPTARIFFKPPPNWASSCVSVDMVEPFSINGLIIDANWSLQTANCEGWLKKETPYYKANLLFNNCPIGPIGGEFSGLIPAGSIIVYDFVNGEITNPPKCLNLGTEDLSKVVIVKLYPNPTDHFIEINSKINFSSYSIYNMDGRKFDEKILTGNKVNVSNLVKGNYFLKLSSPKNETVILRFIKK